MVICATPVSTTDMCRRLMCRCLSHTKAMWLLPLWYHGALVAASGWRKHKWNASHRQRLAQAQVAYTSSSDRYTQKQCPSRVPTTAGWHSDDRDTPTATKPGFEWSAIHRQWQADGWRKRKWNASHSPPQCHRQRLGRRKGANTNRIEYPRRYCLALLQRLHQYQVKALSM